MADLPYTVLANLAAQFEKDLRDIRLGYLGIEGYWPETGLLHLVNTGVGLDECSINDSVFAIFTSRNLVARLLTHVAADMHKKGLGQVIGLIRHAQRVIRMAMASLPDEGESAYEPSIRVQEEWVEATSKRDATASSSSASARPAKKAKSPPTDEARASKQPKKVLTEQQRMAKAASQARYKANLREEARERKRAEQEEATRAMWARNGMSYKRPRSPSSDESDMEKSTNSSTSSGSTQGLSGQLCGLRV